MLDRLWKKGFLHRERDGKVLVYKPSKRENTVEGARIKKLVGQILGGAPEPAVARLVDAVETIDPDLLDRLSHAIEARKKERRGSR